MTCYPLVTLVFGRKTRYKPLWEQGLRADHRIPKLDVGGSNPLARYKQLPNKHLRQIDPCVFLSSKEENRCVFVFASPYSSVSMHPNRQQTASRFGIHDHETKRAGWACQHP